MEFKVEPKFVQAVLKAEGHDDKIVMVPGWWSGFTINENRLPKKGGSIMNIEPVLYDPPHADPMVLADFNAATGVEWAVAEIVIRATGPLA